MALGKGLAQSGKYAFNLNDRVDLEESAQNDHVESLYEIHLGRGIHGIDPVDVDVLPCRRFTDAVTVVDDGSSRLDLGLKLLKGWLVQHYGRVVAG